MKKNVINIIVVVILTALICLLAIYLIFNKNNDDIKDTSKETNESIKSVDYECSLNNKVYNITVDDILDEKSGNNSSANIGDIKIDTKLIIKFYSGFAKMEVENVYKFSSQDGYNQYKFNVTNANYDENLNELTKTEKYTVDEINFENDIVDDYIIENMINSYRNTGYTCQKLTN